MAALNLRHVTRVDRRERARPRGQRGQAAVGRARAAGDAARHAAVAARRPSTAAEPKVARSYLFARCLTIAGGTSEIVRNVIAERILGLPRDPLAR